MTEAMGRNGNLFQRHSTFTLVLFICLGLALLTGAAELLLGYINHSRGMVVERARRYIRLREHRPHSRMLVSYPKDELPYTDNAPGGRYRLDIDDDGFIKPSPPAGGGGQAGTGVAGR